MAKGDVRRKKRVTGGREGVTSAQLRYNMEKGTKIPPMQNQIDQGEIRGNKVKKENNAF